MKGLPAGGPLFLEGMMKIEKKETSEEEKNKVSRPVKPGSPPVCYYHRDCFAYRHGKCEVLYSNDFDGECPFYRSRSDNQKEQEECMRRLIRIGRRDLLDKYMKYQAAAGTFAKDYSDGVAGKMMAYRWSAAYEDDQPGSEV